MKRYLPILGLLLIFSKPDFAQITPDTSFYLKNDKNIYGVVITKNSKVIYQHFFNGKTEHTLMNDQSLTKSIISILIGIAIDKHYITSLDENIGRYFPQLAKDKDQRKQNITIRQIMNQASGLYHENLNDLKDYLGKKDPSGYVLKQSLISEPGSTFYYSNAASHLLSVILTKATGMQTFDFAKKYLLDPMQITDVNWAKMNDGFYDGSGLLSIRMHTQDMAKIGGLLLNNGFYGNKRLVPSNWIKTLNHPDNTYDTQWGFKDSKYALCWYHFNYKGANITYALGWGGQFLVVIPKYKAVIAANASIADEDAIMESARFTDKIFPVLYDYIRKQK
ncbi:serine hydrolase domain-containing protein [Mucilaginibacter sp. AW1-3]